MDQLNRPAPLFGVNINPTARNWQEQLNHALMADDAGIDIAGVQDHAYNPGFLDTWTLLSVIGAQTSNIKLFPNVATLPLRPPAMLAKAAASLDILTGGRVELGLGAGAFWDGIESLGGPRRTPGESLAALREGIEVMRLLWQGPPNRLVSYAGKHYNLAGAQAGPAPAHNIGIWLGSLGPKMQQLTGQVADGWSVSLSYVTPEQAREGGRLITEAALAAGRNPGDIRRLYNLGGVVLRPEQTNLRASRPGVLVGPPELWVDTIAQFYHETGMDTFIFWPAGGDEEGQMRLFAEKVVPAAWDALGSVRA